MPRHRNTNALKHGLYAKRFRSPEIIALKKMDDADFRQEMAMLRVIIDRILERLEQATDDDRRQGLWGSLLAAVDRLNTTAKTHAALSGTDPLVIAGIEDAIQRFRQERNIE